MRIGIDISQLAFENTGISNYLENLVTEMLRVDTKNEYVLFYASLRKELKSEILNLKSNNVSIKHYRIPPTILDFLWNRLHIVPIEWLIGDVDLFITSDWTEPPTKKAKKATFIYDTIIYRNPEETHNQTELSLNRVNISPNIVSSQKRKHKWVKKESNIVFTISKSSKKDIIKYLKIDEYKINVIYPGL